MLINNSNSYKISFNSSRDELNFAAQELQNYLKKIFKTDFSFSDNLSSDFHLALFEDAKDIQELVPDDSPESYIIIINDKRVSFYGNRPRTLLYAVYDFLRHELACEFAISADKLENIPELTSINIPTACRLESPAFPQRGFGFHTDTCVDVDFYENFIDWLAKLRYNRIQINIRLWEQMAEKLGSAIEARDLDLDLGIHSLNFFLPESKYYEEHPEWYADVENRFGRQLRFSCLDSISEISQSITSFLKKHPCVKYLGLWPLDGTDFDSSEIESGKMGDIVLNYVNTITEKITNEFPDLIIDHLAYVGYASPPENITPHPSITTSVCHYWDRSFTQPINDFWYGRGRFAPDSSKEKARKKFHPLRNHRQCCEYLCGWQELGDTMVFSYYPDLNLSCHNIFDISEVIQNDMKYYHAIGAKGSLACYCMHEEFLWFFREVHILAETLWNPDIDLEPLNVRLLNAVFEDVSEEMSSFYKSLDKLHNKALLSGFRLADILSRGIVSTYELSGYYIPTHKATVKQIEEKFLIIENLLYRAQENAANETVKMRVENIIFNMDMQKSFALLGCHVLMAFAFRKEAKSGKIEEKEADKQAISMCSEAFNIFNTMALKYVDEIEKSPGLKRKINSYRSALEKDFPSMLPPSN